MQLLFFITILSISTSNSQPSIPAALMHPYTSFTEFRTIFKAINLFDNEISVLFNLIDSDRVGKVSQKNYGSFHSEFIVPFQKCDADKDYYLNKDEVTACLKSEELSELPADQLEEQDLNYLMNKENINLADYVLLRRMALSWNKCSTEQQLSKVQLICAFNILVSVRPISLGESEQIFRMANIFNIGSITNQQINNTLGFVDFMNYGQLYVLFDQLDQPIKDGSISQQDLIKEINYQRTAIQMTTDDVQQLFMSMDQQLKLNLPIHLQLIEYQRQQQTVHHLSNKLDFLTFAFYFSIHKMFKFHSKTQPGILTADEFKTMYDNPKIFNEKFREYVDAIEFEEVDLEKEEEPKEEGADGAGGEDDNVGQVIKLGQINKDASFFMRSFLQTRLTNTYIQQQSSSFFKNQQQQQLDYQQDSQSQQSLFKTFKFTQTGYIKTDKKSKNRLKKKSQNTNKNKNKNRNKQGGDNSAHLFNMFDSNNKQQLQLLDFIRFFKYTILFVNYDTDNDQILTQQKIKNGQFLFQSPISVSQYEQQQIEMINDSNMLYRFVDIKVWYSLFLKDICFYDDSLSQGQQQQQIHRQAIEQGLKKIGITISKQQFQDCKDGADELGVDTYGKDKVYMQALANQRKKIIEKIMAPKEE